MHGQVPSRPYFAGTDSVSHPFFSMPHVKVIDCGYIVPLNPPRTPSLNAIILTTTHFADSQLKSHTVNSNKCAYPPKLPPE